MFLFYLYVLNKYKTYGKVNDIEGLNANQTRPSY